MNLCVKPTIYLIDDDSAVRDSLRMILEIHGHTVRDYPSAKAFLGDPNRSGKGCLILDLHMPEMSGLALLEILQRQKASMPVIVFTGRGDENLREQVQRAGAVALFAKPVDVDALLQAVDRALGVK